MNKLVLKVGDKIKSPQFKYVRDNHFDYQHYWYNPDGSWSKNVIPRKQMMGTIHDDESNSEAIFEVVAVQQIGAGRIHSDIMDSYEVYSVKKVGDDTYPILEIATTGIDRRHFPKDLIEVV